jgi:hypothetical protein
MPFGKRIDGPAGRRLKRREEVVLAASAQSLGSSRPVVVSDVSTAGAKLCGHRLDVLDRNVLISVGDAELFATIIWVDQDECGVRWDDPVSFDLMQQIKRNGQWASVMGIAA